jgi:hypothetical protein
MEKLSVWLYVEYQKVVDIQEAIRHDNLLDKEKIHNYPQFWRLTLNRLPKYLMFHEIF